MRTIWKFETPFKDKIIINMPKNAEILCVQQDQKTLKPCIWAMVEIENEVEERYFELFGTGHEIYTDMGVVRKYLGTYQYQNGEFVGHLFERII
ncbi:MAG TPA: hypothetical protein PKU71_13570 [bacterium]|nr:hypothetical protein [bacterium]